MKRTLLTLALLGLLIPALPVGTKAAASCKQCMQDCLVDTGGLLSVCRNFCSYVCGG